MPEIYNNKFDLGEKYLKNGFITGVALFLTFYMVIPILAGRAIMDYLHSLPQSLGILLLCTPPPLIILGGTSLAVKFSGCGSIKEKLWFKNWSNNYLVICAIASAAMFVICIVVTMIFKSLLHIFHISYQTPIIIKMAMSCNTTGFIFLTIVAVIIAPITEEILFRRIIFGYIAARVGILPSIVGTSLIFAMFHDSISQMPALFLLGVAFQLLFLHFHSIYPAILLHFFNNATAIFTLLLIRIFEIKITM